MAAASALLLGAGGHAFLAAAPPTAAVPVNTAQSAAGSVDASGTYDLTAKQFNLEAHGNNLDLSQVKYLHSLSDNAQGHLTFSATASGTRDEPRIDGHADLAGLMYEGKPLGSAQLTAHTVNRALAYDLTSHSETAELQVHGQTELRGDFPTQAQAQFLRFNLGSALKLAHVEGITADSSIAGTATVSGPLRYPDRLRGELRLDQAAFAVAEVRLHSEGPLHASLEASRIKLRSHSVSLVRSLGQLAEERKRIPREPGEQHPVQEQAIYERRRFFPSSREGED